MASEVNGTWHTAIEVPGTAALDQGGNAIVDSMSCRPAGNCATGGFYTDAAGHAQAFVVSEPQTSGVSAHDQIVGGHINGTGGPGSESGTAG